MTVSVFNGILDRLQLVHLFLLNYLLQTCSSFIFFISQWHHQLLGFWIKTLRLSLVVPSPLTLTLNQELGAPLWCVMCVTSAPFFFLTSPCSLQNQDLAFRDLEFRSYHAQCPQHSGCSINICYGKTESQPSQPASVMEVLPSCESCLCGPLCWEGTSSSSWPINIPSALPR